MIISHISPSTHDAGAYGQWDRVELVGDSMSNYLLVPMSLSSSI